MTVLNSRRLPEKTVEGAPSFGYPRSSRTGEPGRERLAIWKLGLGEDITSECDLEAQTVKLLTGAER